MNKWINKNDFQVNKDVTKKKKKTVYLFIKTIENHYPLALVVGDRVFETEIEGCSVSERSRETRTGVER